MFEWLSGFDKILVTGPQRAGTRIAAKMIAFDTGHKYVDELDFGMDSLLGIASFLDEKQPVVVHCPVLCRHIHMLAKETDAVVLMRRNIKEITESQSRIRWKWENLELARYDRLDGNVSEIKYQFWDSYQREKIHHPFEVEYDTLKPHPLWVEKEMRGSFIPIQTTRGQIFPVDEKTKPAHHAGILFFDHIDDQSVLLVRSEGNARMLNGTAKLIWELCDGAHNRREILDALCAEYPDVAPATLAHDVDSFLGDLIIQGFLYVSREK